MNRIYDSLVKSHFSTEKKMAFIAGPRQVGKTFSSRQALSNAFYLNWDNPEHRDFILRGPADIFAAVGGDVLAPVKKSVIFDELHKFRRWKQFLKGFYDTYGGQLNICVTGSARLNVFKHGGDSLMGRYFLYRMHPLSIAEIARPVVGDSLLSPPVKIPDEAFSTLLRFGGYPEPFIRNDRFFYNRWKHLRLDQLFEEDIRDLSSISDIARIRILAERLTRMAGGALNYSNLARDLQISVDTVLRWLTLLESIFWSFRIYPYSRNVTKSLLKEPKNYLYDWSLCSDTGGRHENFVACHLLKAVQFWTDRGFGDFELRYVRDKNGREVDFLVIKDNEPWFLCEVKTSETSVTPSLRHFQDMLKAPYAFQATFNVPFVDADCFSRNDPVSVPVGTLLSQLV